MNVITWPVCSLHFNSDRDLSCCNCITCKKSKILVPFVSHCYTLLFRESPIQVPVNKTLTRLDKHIVICLAAGTRGGAAARDHFLTKQSWEFNSIVGTEHCRCKQKSNCPPRFSKAWFGNRSFGLEASEFICDVAGEILQHVDTDPVRGAKVQAGGPTLFYVRGCNSVAALMKPINHMRQWAHAEFTPLAQDTSALDYLHDYPRLHTTAALSLQ